MHLLTAFLLFVGVFQEERHYRGLYHVCTNYRGLYNNNEALELEIDTNINIYVSNGIAHIATRIAFC